MTAHTLKEFERDLDELRTLLSTMAQRVEAQIAASARALTEADAQLARRIIENDGEVDRLELRIDELCQRILALRHPAASDLRLVTTALKIVTDLERCGDLAVNIAERIVDLSGAPAPTLHRDFPRLIELVQQQVRQSLEAFVAGDADKAARVCDGDERVDHLFVKVFNDLLAHMIEDSRNIRRGTALLSIAKHLERIGDHATNIAEMTIFMVRGTNVRHTRSRSVTM